MRTIIKNYDKIAQAFLGLFFLISADQTPPDNWERYHEFTLSVVTDDR